METHPLNAEPPDDAVEGVSLRFESVWKTGRPIIEDYVQLVEPSRRCELLQYLLKIEIAQLRERGEQPAFSEYVNRLPHYAERIWECRDFFESPSKVKADVDTFVPGSATEIEHPTDGAPIDETIETDVSKTKGSNNSVARRDIEANERFFGDYELTEQLGEGGMGVVWKARQMNAGGRFVALKLIRPDKLSQYHESDRKTALARFYNESKAAAQLDHDHITTVYDVGEIEGQPYFAMKYVQGKSLADLIKDQTLTNRQAANYCRQIALALAAAHQEGVLHRDLKPHNVMVETSSDRALLTDFGLAKLSNDDSALTIMDHQVIFGSPPYMSPEQAEHSGKVTPAADIYGLGATLYHALAGRPPFQASSPRETLKQVAENEPAQLRLLNPGVDRDLETICHKTLDKLPEKRYPSAQNLADELGRYLDGMPIHARPITRVEKVWRWCKRNPAVASLISLCVLAVLLGVTGSTWFAFQMKAEATRADINAEISKEKEKKAVAARALADSRLYRTLLSRTELFVKSREIGDIGWTWDAIEDLNEASKIASPDRDDYLVRNLTAKVLNTIDVRKIGEIKLPEITSKQRGEIADVAFADNGKTIFVAELKGTPSCRVVGFDATNFRAKEEYYLNTVNPLEFAARALQWRMQTGFRSVAASANGRWLACGTRYGNVEIWDRQSPGQPVQRLAVHEGKAVNVVMFGRDSKMLFATAHDDISAEDGRIVAFELQEAWRLKETLVDVGVQFCLSNDGKVLAVNDHLAKTTMLDARTMQKIYVVEALKEMPSFSADDRFLVGLAGNTMKVYDTETTALRTFPTYQEDDYGDQVQFLGDTMYCVTSSYGNEGISIYDLVDEQNEFFIPTPGRSRTQFTVSPDGARIAIAGRRQVSIYEIRLPNTRRKLANPGTRAMDVQFSPNSSELAVIFEKPDNTISVSSSYIFYSRDLQTKRRSSSWLNSGVYSGEAPQEFRTPAMAFDQTFVESFNVERLMGPTFRNDQKVHGVPGAIPAVAPQSILIPVNKLLPVNTDKENRLYIPYSAIGNKQLQSLGENEAFQVIVNLSHTEKLPSGCWLFTELAMKSPQGETSFINDERRILPLTPGRQSYCCGFLDKSNADSQCTLNMNLIHKSLGDMLTDRIRVDSILLSAKVRTDRVTTKTRLAGPVAMSRTGDQVWAVADGDRLVSWLYPTGKYLYEYYDFGQQSIAGNSGVLAIALMKDELIVGSRGGALVRLGRKNGEFIGQLAGPGGEINCVEAYSPTDAIVATDLGRLAHFNLATTELTLINSTSAEINSCSVSQNGQFIAYATGSTIFLLQRSENNWRNYLELGPFEHEISCVEISPNGRYLAYGFEAAKTPVCVTDLSVLK